MQDSRWGPEHDEIMATRHLLPTEARSGTHALIKPTAGAPAPTNRPQAYPPVCYRALLSFHSLPSSATRACLAVFWNGPTVGQPGGWLQEHGGTYGTFVCFEHGRCRSRRNGAAWVACASRIFPCSGPATVMAAAHGDMIRTGAEIAGACLRCTRRTTTQNRLRETASSSFQHFPGAGRAFGR
ncbi:hypothetical protein BDW02DRAFT_198275 [Decorospora gaudefroyi]|uniref:Uncharacterized protein n=1 Tax=Decorospora gaudefroyi TaxID=184978 RepID=A0A6A5KPF9_9PLEO|nr:hypothetical protein BDW02DRAFT_198275 [Decorospora gaudefroyi]